MRTPIDNSAIPIANQRPQLKPLGADSADPDPVETAQEFEALLVQQMVSGMRETTNVFGEGGMFGDGPGAETYADWFDSKLADNVTSNAEIGVVDAVLADIARWDTSDKLRNASPTPAR